MFAISIGCGLALLLCGCANYYDITLSNGDIIRSKNRPELNAQGSYVFKDLSGKETSVSSMRVRQIEPAARGSRPGPHF